MHKKIIIIATESSGDYLGYKLINSLNKYDKNIKFYGIGGLLMEKSNFKSLIPIEKLAVNGIVEVLFRIFNFIFLINKTILFIKKINPDLIITIDSPSFNYRVVKKIQGLRPKTKFFHYVAPTVWAWKEKRALQFSNVYDQIFTLFSFEPSFFKSFKVRTRYVGHPIFFEKKRYNRNIKKRKIITFFPGSRINEIKSIFPKMLVIMEALLIKYPDFDLKIVAVPHLVDEIRKYFKKNIFEIIYSQKEKEKIMRNSFFAMATSGTVTLELAYFKIPMIVVYDSNFLTSLIIKKTVKIKWACIVNIIFNKTIIPEFLFEKYNSKDILIGIDKIISSLEIRNKQKFYFEKLPSKLINRGENPSDLVAKYILDT